MQPQNQFDGTPTRLPASASPGQAQGNPFQGQLGYSPAPNSRNGSEIAPASSNDRPATSHDQNGDAAPRPSGVSMFVDAVANRFGFCAVGEDDTYREILHGFATVSFPI